MPRSGNRTGQRPEFTIVDMRSGRDLGGHCVDYLLALRTAFADRPIDVIAPFMDPDPPRNSTFNVYLRGFFGFRRAISDRGVGIVHNSSLNDYICLAAAALTMRPSRRGFCLMMLYRNPSIESFGAGGPALNRVVIWLIRRMIASGVLRPASDSEAVLRHWIESSGAAGGSLVPTPPLPSSEGDGDSALELPEGADPLVVIPGRMRLEKGAANYPVVAGAVLSRFKRGAIAMQVSEDDAAAAAALKELRTKYSAEPRVALLGGHLSGEDYAALLAAADLVALPYDVKAYGEGSSGVVGDALNSGATVVAAPIAWIADGYADDPRVVFVNDPSSEQQLGDALERAAQADSTTPAHDAVQADFSARWNAAADEALVARDEAAA